MIISVQLGHVQTDRVWHNNYGILATNINLVTAPGSGTVTVGDNWPQCTAKAVAKD